MRAKGVTGHTKSLANGRKNRKRKKSLSLSSLDGCWIAAGIVLLLSLSLSLRHHLLKGISQVNVWRIYNVSPQLNHKSLSHLFLYFLWPEKTHTRGVIRNAWNCE
jgi:hypothetical protein